MRPAESTKEDSSRRPLGDESMLLLAHIQWDKAHKGPLNLKIAEPTLTCTLNRPPQMPPEWLPDQLGADQVPLESRTEWAFQNQVQIPIQIEILIKSN